jgi:hypothetical protein
MSLSHVVISNPVETPAQLIKQYVDWLKSHPSGAGANEPASVGFMMACPSSGFSGQRAG